MTNIHKELHFENEICAHLAAHGWLHSADDKGYDRELALFPEDLIWWIQETQPETWNKVKAMHNGSTQKKLLERLVKVLTADGTLSALRHGFKDLSAGRVSLCQFKPATTLNATTIQNYGKVRLRVVQQVHYSTSNNNSIDLVFFVNGIPVATSELKTDFTQSIEDAVKQYKFDRPTKDKVTKKEEPLLTFKRGALVHFAVSTEEVQMTTKLDGVNTRFLPFNLGDNGGKGNPVNPNGFMTAYFWEYVLQRDNFLEILGRFMHLETFDKLDKKTGKKVTKTAMIFPRFHQFNAVSKLIATAKVEGPGHRYLVQHSAGSGKTNTIAWTAHQLSSLHDADNKKVFDSVIVVTDRTVLDSQLQDAIYQFEHKQGLVKCIKSEMGESKSAQLAQALLSNTPIIIVTIQTFPFVIEALAKADMAGKRYAIIADEAHTSQSGAVANKVKNVLSPAEKQELDDGGEIDIEALLEAEMASRAQPKNISYFAFTATPKSKTMELFGRPDGDGKPAPFHLYTMQQAIEEGFILDVLKNYTPYKLAFKIAHGGEDYDSETVDKSKALKSLMKWVRLHPYNIAQKVEVIVEHFKANVSWRLDGKAKAMVVTGSRKEAVRYKAAIDKYIIKKAAEDKAYLGLQAMVAFSGTVIDPETGPGEFTEHNLNPGLNGRDLRDAFDEDDYQVMIVANKFQTGFDQPLLVSMYVDKKLSGVAAVQTLSRLNRTFPGKDVTFVLDFVNDPSEILESFAPYYRAAQLSDVSDPNVIFDLQSKLDGAQIYTDQEIDNLVTVLLKKPTQAAVSRCLQPAQSRFKDGLKTAKANKDTLEIEKLEEFKKNVGSFVRAYDFLSQIINYADTELEKRSMFLRLLQRLLIVDIDDEEIDIEGIELTHYQLRNKGNQTLILANADGTTLYPAILDLGTTKQVQEPEKVYWNEILEKVNKLFEGDQLTDADAIAVFNHVADKMTENPMLQEQATATTEQQFGESPDFKKTMRDAFLVCFENHQSIIQQLLTNDKLKDQFAELLLPHVYGKLTRTPDAGIAS